MVLELPRSRARDWTSSSDTLFVAAFICLHTVTWTVFATLSNTGALHGDMIEAYAWGREYQLGYFKHPPLWAWLAGAWFDVFPRTNWAFYLLANLNAAIAVVGVWRLLGLFTNGRNRVNAAALTLLFPFYTVQGHQFNANYMELSLWPWTAYFFVLSFRHHRFRDSLLFGIMAATCVLSKYYSVILLASCFLASLADVRWRRYYRSVHPYFAVVICTLLCAPHLVWLITHHFAPLKYAEAKTHYSQAAQYASILTFIGGCIAFHAVALTLIWFSRAASSVPQTRKLSKQDRPFARILAVAPCVLTVAAALAGHVRLSTNFAAPIFFLTPPILVDWLRPSPEKLNGLATRAAVLLYAGALLVSPALPYIQEHVVGQEAKRAQEVAEHALRLWRAETAQPLRIAAGSDTYAMGLAFYSGENTSASLNFDGARSPWVTREMLSQDGFLAVCEEGDSICQDRSVEFGGPALKESRLALTGRPRKPLNFRIYVALPQARP